MEELKNEILDFEPEIIESKRRRSLLPWWIKVFIWFFMITGAFAPVGLVLGNFGANFIVSLYGLETYEPVSLLGLFISLLFILKGFTAFGLWTEKDWAIKLGQIDAVIGIIICVFMMIINPLFNLENGFILNFRLELFLVIAYLIKLNKINDLWLNTNSI